MSKEANSDVSQHPPYPGQQAPYGYPVYPPPPQNGYPQQQQQQPAPYSPAAYPGTVGDGYPPHYQGYPPPGPAYPGQPYPTGQPYPPAAQPYPPAQPYPSPPGVAAMPMVVVAPPVVALPMQQIVELDVGAMMRLPPVTDITDQANIVPGPGQEFVPRPLVWVETEWMKKPFVYLSTRLQANAQGAAQQIHAYQCALHRLDGVPCGMVVEKVQDASLTEHLRAHHNIVEIPRPQRQWKRSLLGSVFSLACLDFFAAPCCFVSRMAALNFSPQGNVVASYLPTALYCSENSDCCGVCVTWSFAVPIMLIFYIPFPCLPCLGVAACFPDLELRQRVLQKHNIMENECESGMKVCFCCPCSNMQVHHEIEAAGVWPGYCCCSRDTPLPSPDEVQQHFHAITREAVVRSRMGYNMLAGVALQAMQ